MDDKLPAKTVKFTSLENLYVYSIRYTVIDIEYQQAARYIKCRPVSA